MLNIAEFLFEHRENNTDPGWLANALGHLAWQMPDNGQSIHETLESWLKSGSLEQAKVSLAYDEALLLGSSAEAQRVLSQLSARFPELYLSCQDLLSRWASLPSGA